MMVEKLIRFIELDSKEDIMRDLREDCNFIVDEAIHEVLPNAAVEKALEHFSMPKGNLYLVAIGKAAYSMAFTAKNILKDKIYRGIVITKYGYALNEIENLEIYEAGHPLPDENTLIATEKVLEMTAKLSQNDMVLFLVSGGGSSLFEKTFISLEDLISVNKKLINSGASISEINAVRKRISYVKGGYFAKHCYPAKIFSIVLSDVVGDYLDVIASGPAYPDYSTVEDAQKVLSKYKLSIPEECMDEFFREPVTSISNVTTVIAGNVQGYCKAASDACKKLGYKPTIISTDLTEDVTIASEMIIKQVKDSIDEVTESVAYIYGGEIVVNVTGDGLGGRNQDLALRVAKGIANIPRVAVFCAGSDGSDGPTDAAGGFVDGGTMYLIKKMEMDYNEVISNQDSYHCLKALNQLIVTGPTGSNVNDIYVILIDKSE